MEQFLLAMQYLKQQPTTKHRKEKLMLTQKTNVCKCWREDQQRKEAQKDYGLQKMRPKKRCSISMPFAHHWETAQNVPGGFENVVQRQHKQANGQLHQQGQIHGQSINEFDLIHCSAPNLCCFCINSTCYSICNGNETSMLILLKKTSSISFQIKVADF